MKVSKREESLAIELYTWDMRVHDGEFVPWSQQIEQVKDSFRKQAMRVVNSKWFKKELAAARGVNDS